MNNSRLLGWMTVFAGGARAVPRSEVDRLEPLPFSSHDDRIRLPRVGPGVARALIAARMRQPAFSFWPKLDWCRGKDSNLYSLAEKGF